MITKLLKIGTVILFTGLLSCIDEYWPEIDAYQNLLVVDGMITSGPGPFRVDLGLSTSVDRPEYRPYSGCEVFIEDDAGGILPLSEEEDGTYVSAGSGEEGVTGRSYRLRIISPSGKEYASGYEELPAPASIDSVYPVLENKIDPLYPYELTGYQFYVNSTAATEGPAYYLWNLRQTYEYNADFYTHIIYNGSSQPFNPIDSLYTCWITENVNEIFVFGTAGLDSPDLDRYPLNYVSTETRALTVRYSLLVDQFTVSEKTYRFWNEVRDQNAGEASLYTKQLYQIRGNVKNTGDALEPVLGYFTVAGKDSKRIFADRPQQVIEFNYTYCVLTEGAYDAYAFIGWTIKNTWPLYVYRDPSGRRALLHQNCMDCRRKGGTIQRPEFWTDSQK